jgi:hypothetical protein
MYISITHRSQPLVMSDAHPPPSISLTFEESNAAQ